MHPLVEVIAWHQLAEWTGYVWILHGTILGRDDTLRGGHRLRVGLMRLSLLVTIEVRYSDHVVAFDWHEVDVVCCLSGHLLLDELVQIVVGPVAKLR